MTAKTVLKDFIKESGSRFFTFSELARYLEKRYGGRKSMLCDRMLRLDCVREVGRTEMLKTLPSPMWYEYTVERGVSYKVLGLRIVGVIVVMVWVGVFLSGCSTDRVVPLGGSVAGTTVMGVVL